MLLDEYSSPPDNASLLNFFVSPEEAADFNAETDSLLPPPNEDPLPPCYADVLAEEAVEEERLMETIQEFCTRTITRTVLNSLPSGNIYVVPMVEPEDETTMDQPEPDDTEVRWLSIVPVRERWGAIQYPFVVATDLNKLLYLGCRIYHPWYGDGRITELPYATAKYIVFNGQFVTFAYRAGPFHATFITHRSMFTRPPPPLVPASAAAIHTWWRALRSYLRPTSHAEHEAEASKELELLPINREMVRRAEMEPFSSVIYSYTYSSQMPEISPSSQEHGVSPHFILM
ncbi:hypothetical protein ARMGADRAFT_1025306 [Armillaria gallica]|uniref:Uncharacterized protein n=1 Tax=Armillaria gallica TaxID=47427 RepID=A0A2H3E5J2_ARMGA|nr:hypothetical protein ARMGADRAFT_1025306 [Armillaria gallica]